MKKAYTLLIILIVLGMLTSCGPTSTPEVDEPDTQETEAVETTEPEPDVDERIGGILNRQVSYLTQFDPIYVADSTFYAVSNIFSLLFRLQGQEMEIIPDLATSWEWEDDTTIVFHLREGMMWHDGNAVFAEGESREVVADDVVYSVLRHLQTEGAAPPQDLVATFESIEAVDEYTVRISFNSPPAMLFSRGRGLTKTGIVPQEAVEFYGEDFGLNPIGSGPFEFVEYKPDESLVLQRNEDYFIEPFLDGVVYHVIPDNEAALISFENAEVDILWQVPPTELERLSGDARFTVHGGGCPVSAQLIFNVNHAVWGDVRFRQAVAYALDGEAININVMGAMHIKGAGTAGPGVTGYVDTLYDDYFYYDPPAAEALLTDMGWEDTNGDDIRDKDGEQLAFPLEVFASDTNAQFGAAIVTQLQQVGIEATLETVEVGTYIQDFQTGAEKVFLMTGWCGEGGTNSLWGEGAFASSLGYQDQDIFDLLDEAAGLVDRDERDTVLKQATEMIYSQYWGVCLGFHDFSSASLATVHDFGGSLWYENLVTEVNNVWVDK